MIKVGSDFSGVGAFNQALKRLGIDYEEVFACDMDKYARQTFIHNYGEPKYYPENVYNRQIPTESLDIYMTSPPCQAFSLAGKRLGKDDKRGILFFNSHEFIKVNKPKYFIFENVKGLLSDDNGNTFNEWINLLGGKSVNGSPIIFPYDESVPYHVYWKVLNAKNYGVPQNRERVFIIGIRDDADNKFSFPVEIPLNKRLKDVLEDKVDEKYFLSENAINRIITSKFNQGFKDNNTDYVGCITALYGKIPSDGNYIKIKSATSKGYEEATEGDSINFSVPNSETRRGRVGKQVAQTLDTACNQAVIIYNIPQIVKVKKHEVNIIKLQQCLKKHKNKSINKISTEINVLKTEAEHWFRTDKYFSIPSAEIWFKLKKCLNIKTTEFDLQITEFIEKESVFEKSNRVYDENGIAPTITSTSADERILTQQDVKIAAIRGRETNEGLQQELEIGSEETSNSITTVQKDNVLIYKEYRTEEAKKKRKETGTNDFRDKECGFFPQDYSNTLTSIPKDNLLWIGDYRADVGLRIRKDDTSPCIMASMRDQWNEKFSRGNPPIVGYNDKRLNETIAKNDLPEGEPKAIDTYNQKVQDNVSTLTEPHHNTTRLCDGYKIRRLTPRECFRLMDFPDTFTWPVSDSQAYKQAGNSIVVEVLAKIISKLKL